MCQLWGLVLSHSGLIESPFSQQFCEASIGLMLQMRKQNLGGLRVHGYYSQTQG